MRIKKFRGKTIVEALGKVKAEFGEDAVILSSEKIKEKGETFYEVTAAVEEKEVEIRRNKEVLKTGSTEGIDREIKEEIKEIKQMLRDLLEPRINNAKYIKLVENGVPPWIAKKILDAGKEVADYIETQIRKKGGVPNSKCRIFVGDSGSGKTTSVFKLAVWYKMNKNAKVMVLSFDNYKIGAKFQSERMADLLELDFANVDVQDFKEIIPVFANYDYILVDTPGLDKRFIVEDLEELFLTYPSVRFQWVVKATEHYSYLLKLWENIKRLPVESIFLTFTDKVKNSLPLLWLLEDEVPPVTFISTGERLPEDITKVAEEDLIKFFLRGIETN